MPEIFRGEDLRRSEDHLREYLVGDYFSQKGFLSRAESHVSKVGNARWRLHMKAAITAARREVNGDCNPDILLPLISHIQRKLGRRCDHNFRTLAVSDRYTGERARECQLCGLKLMDDRVPDAYCHCGNGMNRDVASGGKGPLLKSCSRQCQSELVRQAAADKAAV